MRKPDFAPMHEKMNVFRIFGDVFSNVFTCFVICAAKWSETPRNSVGVEDKDFEIKNPQ